MAGGENGSILPTSGVHWSKSLCEGALLRFDCYDFYKLGMAIHPLTEIREGPSVSDAWGQLYHSKNELNTFFLTFPLKTCRNPASELFKALKALVPDDFAELRFNNEDGSVRLLDFFEALSIREAAKEFETVLKAELNGWDSLFVSQKGAFSTAELISQAEIMVPEAGRSIMSPDAIADFRQSGMCLAFSLNTASAFHAARATESVIRSYYQHVVGRLPAVKMRSWGAYHRNLSSFPNSDKKVLGWLKHLTDEYRNPVLHPDEMLNADTALEFINACIALITSIARAMPATSLQVTP